MEDIANVDESEIEISPAMIDAGAAVLCHMTLRFANEEFYAAEVYRAMCAAHSSTACDSPCRA